MGMNACFKHGHYPYIDCPKCNPRKPDLVLQFCLGVLYALMVPFVLVFVCSASIAVYQALKGDVESIAVVVILAVALAGGCVSVWRAKSKARA